MKLAPWFLISLLALSGCNTPAGAPPVVVAPIVDGQRQITRNVVAASGMKVKITFAYSVNPDCSSEPGVTPRLVQAPENGTLTFTPTKDFPNFVEPNPRTICNAKRVDGILVEYRSRDGYVGEDTFVYDMFFPQGLSNHVTGHAVVK